MKSGAEIDKGLLQLRIIIGAMMGGIVIFGVAATAMGMNAEFDPDQTKMFLLALAGLCVMELPAYFVVRRVLMGKIQSEYQQSRRSEDPSVALLAQMTTLTIIGGAMAEGVSLFALVIVLLTGARVALIVPGLGLIVLSLLFPTRYRLSEFVANVTGRRW